MKRTLARVARSTALATFALLGLLSHATSCAAPTETSDAVTSNEALSSGANTALGPLQRNIGGHLRTFMHVEPSDAERTRATSNPVASPQLFSASSLPLSVSLRSLMTPVRDQGGRNTCAEFASTGLIEFYTGGDISEQAMVSLAYGGNDGGPLPNHMKNYLVLGLVDERLSEYDPGDANVHVPSGSTYASLYARSAIAPAQPLTQVTSNAGGANAISYIRQQLATSHPVAIGIFVPDGSMDSGHLVHVAYETCKLAPITSANLGSCPGHALIITGYDDVAQQFEIKNQWGTDWGNGGYGTMTYDFFVHYQAGPLLTIEPDATPIPTAQSIQDVYQTSFGRNAMAWEVDTWVENFNNGWTLSSMLDGFEHNPQFDDAIVAVYQETLGRTPAQSEIIAWENNIRTGGWSITRMKAAFCDDPQNAQAVTNVYQDVLGRAPTASDMTTWRANIASHGWTIPMMRNSFALSAACGSAIDDVVLSALDRHATDDEIALYERFIHDYLWTLVDLKNYLTSTTPSTVEPWISAYPVIFN